MKGIKVISELKKKFRVKSDRMLTDLLGNSIPAIHNWKKRKSVTERQIAGLIHSARKSGARASQKSAIRPIAEFFPIEACDSKQKKKFEIFTEKDGEKIHPYLSGLKGELSKKHGVYVFFDSRGQAIYAGKARKQKLWKEINNAFNRERGAIQKIKRVKHPSRRQAYRTTDEKARQIIDLEVPLYDLASYFSAYEVSDGMVEVVESLLVRCFANDLLNKRMEKFSAQRKT